MKPVPLVTHRMISLEGDAGTSLANRLFDFVAVCVILYFGQDIIIPMILALLLAILLAPAVIRLRLRLRLRT